MVLSELQTLVSGFEGCEKKLEIDFGGKCSVDMRVVSRATWDRVLECARCEVVTVIENAHCRAYLLSESSLFVFERKIILKTCGTTCLLKCLPELLDAASGVGAKPQFVQFSRSNFMFPSEQPYPHSSFEAEVACLNRYFSGSGYILGAVNGPRWNLYVADVVPAKESDKEQTLEVLMFDLDPETMRQFYRLEDDTGGDEASISYNGRSVTQISGIADLITGAHIDSHLFSPCGYSCNGLKDDVYFTIHVTPEPECSFVSFETNIKLKSYSSLIRQVLKVFKPASFCCSLFVDKGSLISDSTTGVDWDFDGFSTVDQTVNTFDGLYNVSVGIFKASEPRSSKTDFGSAALRERVLLDYEKLGDVSSDTLRQVAVSAVRRYHDVTIHSPSSIPESLMLNDKMCTNLDSPRSVDTVSDKMFTSDTESELTVVSSDSVTDMSTLTGDMDMVSVSSGTTSTSHSRTVSCISDDFSMSDLRMKHNTESPCVCSDVAGSLISDLVSTGEQDEAFFLVDVGEIVRNFSAWRDAFPTVRPFYDVSCNSEKAVLAALAALGCGFSCASTSIIKDLLQMGVDPGAIMFAHPWMSVSQLKFAHAHSLGVLTFANAADLEKIREHYTAARLVLSWHSTRSRVAVSGMRVSLPSRLEILVTTVSPTLASGRFDSVVADPSCFLLASTHYLAVSVIARRAVEDFLKTVFLIQNAKRPRSQAIGRL
eukprot:513051_1